MSFSLKEKGHKKMVIDIKGLDAATKKGVRQGFYRLGKSLKATANKNILERPRSGRVYSSRDSSGRRRRHIASVSGESFANRSGAARRQLGFDVRGSQNLEFGFRSNSKTDEYTGVLESDDGLNRPALKIAIKQNQRNSVNMLESGIKKAIK